MKLQPRSLAHLKRFWTAYVVLLASLALSFAGYLTHTNYLHSREQARFTQAGRLVFDQIEAQLGNYVTIMQGVRALFSASKDVTPAEVSKYFHVLKVRDLEQNSGLEGIGLVWRVTPAERQAHIANMRKSYPTYRLSAAKPNQVAFPITHLEALGPNASGALGWDVTIDPIRREALERALRTGQPAVTAKTRLFRADGVPGPLGFIIYLPIFREAAGANTNAEPIGCVFASYDAEKLWTALFRKEPTSVELEIYDAPEPAKDALIYDKDHTQRADLAYKPAFENEVKADIFGRTWSFAFYAPPDRDRSFEQRVPLLILGLGVVGSFLFFGFVYVQAKGRTTAEALTRDLLASERAVRTANTELARKVNESSETTERLAVTLRAIRDAVVATDVEQRVILMNPVAEEMSGVKLSQALGQSIDAVFRLYSADSREPLTDAASNSVSNGKSSDLVNRALLINPEKKELLVLRQSAPTRDSAGQVTGAVYVFRDVTQEQKSQEELLRASKLEALGLLAGGIAHDFNNVLTGIVGNLSLLREHPGLPAEVSERLALLEKSAFRARQLTLQLLTFAKGGSPIKQTASIAEMISDSVEFSLRGSNVRAEFHLAPDLAPVEVDPGQMSQVIQNLVINSKQAMPNGGVLRVQAENFSIQEKGSLPLPKGRYIRISIQDSGCGIKAEHLSKIFDPYFTTKPKGSGLGLATAYSIMKQHDGLITVESDLGKGSTFHLYLPASARVSAAPAKTEAKPQQFRGTGRVLAMDDEPAIRVLLSAILKHFGYDSTEVPDGRAALLEYKKALEAGQPYQVVIMDLTIPGGMGGREAITELRALDPQVKAIVSSGYSNDPVMAEYQKYGFAARVEKPYRLQELGAALRGIMQPPAS